MLKNLFIINEYHGINSNENRDYEATATFSILSKLCPPKLIVIKKIMVQSPMSIAIMRLPLETSYLRDAY